MKSNLTNTFLLFLLNFIVLGMTGTNAQTLNKPTAADNPNLAGNSIWTAACGSDSFNQYYVNFTWLPSVAADNEFILELSDANGLFTDPTELSRVNDKNTTFDFNFEFALPNDTRGDAYRFRVRSTSPAKTSPESNPYEMYYIDFNTTLKIRELGDASATPAMQVELCDGGTTTLEVFNVPNGETYRYNWYRNTSPYNVGGHGPSIEVSQAGFYVVELDYGATCSGSSNTQSLSIEIKLGTSVGLALNPPTKTALCTGELVAPLEANMNYPDLYYTWYKDGTIVQASTQGAHTYALDTNDAQFPGSYTVKVQGNGICTETSNAVDITQAGVFSVNRDNPANIAILPGGTANLSVSADTSPVTYQWYRDNVLISGETGSTLATNAVGVYHAEVSLSGGSCPLAVKTSQPTTVVHPNSYNFTIDYATEYTECINTSVALEIARIDAVLANGSTMDVTSDLLSSFSYQWTRNGVNVSGANSSNISLTQISENGDYSLLAVLDSFNQTSNALPVRMLVNENLAIASNSTIICGEGETAAITTGTNLTGETFRWYKDGTVLPDATQILTITEPGTYQLLIERNGCDLRSNEISIAPFDDSSVILDPPNADIVFPEGGNRNIYISGAESYQWFNENNVLLSDTDTLNLTLEGSYLVIATVNDCQVSRRFTVSYQDTFAVPNVVTANGDGYNDQWILPNTYTKDPEINVIIYNHKGEEILNQFQYKNNWPEASMSFPKQNMIFYYTIKDARQTLKKGTITVIR